MKMLVEKEDWLESGVSTVRIGAIVVCNLSRMANSYDGAIF